MIDANRPPGRPQLDPVDIGFTTITPNSESHHMISTHTLQPGGRPYETEGIAYVLDHASSAIVVNGISTFAIPRYSAYQPGPIAIGATTITADGPGQYMVGTHTLRPDDSSYQTEGTTYILDTSANAIIVDGVSTYHIPQNLPSNLPAPITVGSTTSLQTLQDNT